MHITITISQYFDREVHAVNLSYFVSKKNWYLKQLAKALVG